jgi:Family of unknown function (DUF5683)
MRLFTYLFTYLMLVTATILSAQTDSTMAVFDSAQIIRPTKDLSKPNYWRKNYPDPSKALLFSAVLPGAGQIYNKQYWKVPLVYGVFVGAILYYDDQRGSFRRLRKEYIARADGKPDTVPESALVNVSSDKIQNLRNYYRSQSETAGLLIVGTYLLTAAEAYVGAHLKTFDVSDDLSLRIRPSTQSGVGLGIVLAVR